MALSPWRLRFADPTLEANWRLAEAAAALPQLRRYAWLAFAAGPLGLQKVKGLADPLTVYGLAVG